MMYESIREWRDLEDNHLYHAGDKFPHDGREVPAGRIAALCGTQNKAGFALIKALPVPVEEAPTKKYEPAKKAAKKPNKAG